MYSLISNLGDAFKALFVIYYIQKESRDYKYLLLNMCIWKTYKQKQIIHEVQRYIMIHYYWYDTFINPNQHDFRSGQYKPLCDWIHKQRPLPCCSWPCLLFTWPEIKGILTDFILYLFVAFLQKVYFLRGIWQKSFPYEIRGFLA